MKYKSWSLLLSCAVFHNVKWKECYLSLQQTNVFITATNNILSSNLYARFFQAMWSKELNHSLYLLNKALKCAGCWSLLISRCQNGICKSQGRLTVPSSHHLWVKKLWWVEFLVWAHSTSLEAPKKMAKWSDVLQGTENKEQKMFFPMKPYVLFWIALKRG